MSEERRTVLKVLTGTVAAASAGIIAGPSVALIARTGSEASSDGGQWLRVQPLDTLELDTPTKANLIGEQTDAWTRATGMRLGSVWLIRDGSSSVKAYSTVCPHLGCAIDFENERFVCPCHDSYFDLRGQTTSGPSPRGMDPLSVRITDGWIYVKFQKFRQGTAERTAL